MKRSGTIAGMAVGVALVGGTVATAQDTDELLVSAEEAADEAVERVRAMEQAAGEAQGFGSEAFLERHATLAGKFEERAHPVFDEHPARRVHRALANGEHPTDVGAEQAAAAKRMAEARRQMTAGADGTPAAPGNARRPAHAGPGGS